MEELSTAPLFVEYAMHSRFTSPQDRNPIFLDVELQNRIYLGAGKGLIYAVSIPFVGWQRGAITGYMQPCLIDFMLKTSNR